MPITPVASGATEYYVMFTVDGVEFSARTVQPMNPDEEVTDGAAQKLVDLLNSSPDISLGTTAKTRSETLFVTPS